MPDPCQQSERIARIETAVSGLDSKVDSLASSVQTLVIQLAPVIERVQEHERALRGSNGDTGILARIQRNTDILLELQGTVKGHEEETGLVGAVSDIKKKVGEWADSQKWMSRLVVGWLVTTTLGALIWAIVQSVQP